MAGLSASTFLSPPGKERRGRGEEGYCLFSHPWGVGEGEEIEGVFLPKPPFLTEKKGKKEGSKC